MADYAPLLARAIAALPGNDPESRQAIYQRARAALERQLAAHDPPLDEAEQLRIRLALEDSIRATEAEQVGAAQASNETAEPTPTPPPLAGGVAVPPPQPAKRAERTPQRHVVLFALAGFLALAGMGALALINRDGIDAYLPRTASQPVGEGGKREGRLPPTETPPARPAVPEPAPPAEPAPSADNQPVTVTSEKVAPNQAAPPVEPKPAAPLPVLSRGFMIVEVPGGAPNQFEGQADWKFVPEPGARTEARTIRLEAEFPGAGLKFDMTIARNTDPALGASHTVLLVFDPKAGFEAIREMSALEWRERETVAGTPFAGSLVPMQENVFLFGLDYSEAARSRNLELMKSQRWLVFEFRLANSRRGAILIEKGTNGENAIAEALAEWK